jgi:hypothetical protein
MAQFCNSSLPPLSNLENLYLEHRCSRLLGINDVENTKWFKLLPPFTGAKNLYLSEKFARGIICALEELAASRMTEILAALQKIFAAGYVSRHVWTAIGKFVAARRLSGHFTIAAGAHW